MEKLFEALGVVFFFALFFNSQAVAYAPPAVTLVDPPAHVLSAEDIVHYADELDFSDPKLVASIAKVESDFRPLVKNVHNGVVYYGLMQISYETAKMVGFKGRPRDLMNWRVNVKYATRYLRMLKREHRSLRKTIAAYNAGDVFFCKRRCPKGKLINEAYVRKVINVYADLD